VWVQAKYLEDNPQLGTYLMRLRNAGKKARCCCCSNADCCSERAPDSLCSCLRCQVFLLTNSPFKFVDVGMQYMLRDALKQHGACMSESSS
jgi:hypothetical protein